ncbi:MAG: DEAD/DEAH box helicase [Paraclostridium sp.]
MNLDIVRGKISKPEQTKQLIENVTNYMNNNNDEGTLYLGYPLSANRDSALTIDAMLVTVNKGMIAFIFGNSNDTENQLKENQDELYYHIDYYLKSYSSLRKGRNLSFTPIVITVVPNEISTIDEDYIICTEDKVVDEIEKSEGFNSDLFRKLCEILQKVSEIKPRKRRANVTSSQSYGGIMKKIEKEIANLDQWQKKAAFEIPEGPQRIRGLAGSGKTIVLALKAAYLHTQYPDMKIAITYYTRALYQQYVNLIEDFVKELSGELVDWDRLDIIHAWGSNSEKGVYSSIAKSVNIVPYNLTSAISKFGRENTFSKVCEELTNFIDDTFEPIYDAILIDEAQDMPSAFFRIIYKATKNPKRIVWAYDELQNLSDGEMPSLEDMFGIDENGSLNINIENQEDEAKRDIILPICYRNPPWTLALAHSLGFGIYHNNIIQMFESVNLWKEIGYTVTKGELEMDKSVTLSRKNSSTPEYFEELLNRDDSVITNVFNEKQKQYAWVAEQISKNITEDELDPDDILVIFPDTYYTKGDYREFEKYLMHKNIESILAGVNTDRDTFKVSGKITCSHIYRAKGNESPMVYIMNADFCATGLELAKLRNILFTSITRSRAWVRICGVGEKMNILNEEILKCIDHNYELEFKVPNPKELEQIRRVNRERTSEEKNNLVKAKTSVSDLIEQFERGELDPELIPEIQTLINIFNTRK